MLSFAVCLKHALLPSCVFALILLIFSAIDLVSFQPVVITVPFRQSKSDDNPMSYVDTQTDKANTRDASIFTDHIQSGTLSLETKMNVTDRSSWNISSNAQHQGHSQVHSQGHSEGQEKTVIIGIGTGRSGTLSTAKFFDQQRDSSVSHEWQQCKGLWWNEASFTNAKARYETYIARKGTFVGDVALWNLPYVEYFLQFPNVKVVAVKRVKHDTVRSFEKWFGGMKHFPWITDEERKISSYKDHKTYDNCYPKYKFSSSNPSIREGASIYWEDYYTQVRACNEIFPF